MKNPGFTLIETMIAVSVLMIAVVGPLYAAGRATEVAALARNQLTASYLAQEGVEYIRAMRDNAFIVYGYTGTPDPTWWNDYFLIANSASPYDVGQCVAPAQCTLDTSAAAGSALSACSGTCPPLLLSTTFYNQSSGAPTMFTRTVTLSAVNSSVTETEELVTVDVSWSQFGQTFHVTSSDHLTPWQ